MNEQTHAYSDLLQQLQKKKLKRKRSNSIEVENNDEDEDNLFENVKNLFFCFFLTCLYI